MRTIALRTKVTTILAIAVVLSLWQVNAAMAAKEVFTRSKPHVNVGTIGGEPAIMWFHANAKVFEDGKATGTIQVRVVGGESFLYRVVQGEATVDDEDNVLEMILILERVGEGGTPTGETDVATVLPSSTTEPCRIYSILGTQVNVEAETTTGFRGLRHEHTRPE